MKMKEYRFTTYGPDITAQVEPTMEALGDQPWRVKLTFEPPFDNIPPISRMIEASSGFGAASQAVEDWLEENGPETSYSVSL